MTEIVPIPIGSVNCYLLRRGGRHVLVDAAPHGSERKLVRCLQRLGLSPEALDLLVITHGHADHSGGATFLRERYGVRIAMHPLDGAGARPLIPRGLRGRMLLAAAKVAVGAQTPIAPDDPLEDGLSLSGYGIDAEILHLPGHTAGSAGVWFDDGRLICGDALMHFGTPTLCFAAENFEAAESSLERLRALSVTEVYPGHGKPFAFAELK